MSESAPQGTRIILVLSGSLLSLLGALLLPFAIGVAGSSPEPSSPAIDAFASGLVIAVAAGPLVSGLWMIARGAPWFPHTVWVALRGLSSGQAWGLARRLAAVLAPTPARLIASSLWRGALALAIGLLGALVLPRSARPLAMFAAMSGYALVDPLLNALSRHWWLNTLLSGASFVALLLVAGVISDVNRFGESSMIFVAPLMAYPAAVALSGLVRLVRWHLSRR